MNVMFLFKAGRFGNMCVYDEWKPSFGGEVVSGCYTILLDSLNDVDDKWHTVSSCGHWMYNLDVHWAIVTGRSAGDCSIVDNSGQSVDRNPQWKIILGDVLVSRNPLLPFTSTSNINLHLGSFGFLIF